MNAVNRTTATRLLLDKTLRIHPDALLPEYHTRTLRRRLGRLDVEPRPQATAQTRGRVVLFTTCYGNYNEPQIGEDLIAVFQHNGWLHRLITPGKLPEIVMKEPREIAVAPDGRALMILDTGNRNIIRLERDDAEKPLIFGQPGKNDGQLARPVTIAVDDDGRTYVLDSGQKRVSVFDRDGYFTFNFGDTGQRDFPGSLDKPSMIAVTSAGDVAYVYDGYEIKKFSLDHDARQAAYQASMGGRGTGLGQFQRPVGIGCDRQGLLYIADRARDDIQVIDFRGLNGIVAFTGVLEEWSLTRLHGMAVNPDGRVYLFEQGRMIGISW